MLEIIKNSSSLQLVYSYSRDSGYIQEDWVIQSLKNKGWVSFSHNIFKLSISYLDNKNRLELNETSIGGFGDLPNVTFNIGSIVEVSINEKSIKLFRIFKGVILDDRDIFFDLNYEPDITHFIAETNISVFKQIGELIHGNIYVGSNHPQAIPLDEFYSLIESFPNTYEKKLYAQARISSVLKNYIDDVRDAENTFINYRNKKTSSKQVSLKNAFAEYELLKYKAIYSRLMDMLNNEQNYNEREWQIVIVDILLLLFPKYIAVFSEVRINADDIKEKFLDYLFVDSNGHVDIVEIKQPFNNAIMTKGMYRDNFIPLRELSGTIMQIEKYIYYLNRWGKRGEKKLTEAYKEKLPESFDLFITNPKGLIMGRDDNLSKDQKKDFEVVKRKYKNVVDIISYDDLLRRLKIIIEQYNKY